MNFKKYLVFFLFLLSITPSFAQILDDSTKQVYSFKTTHYYLEDDLLNNRKTFYTPDTSLTTFHLTDFNLRDYWHYQNLGEIGTASKFMFYAPAEGIGTEMGYNVYKNFAFDAQKVQYFDTKSPYTNMYYVQGANGQTNLRFTHSQNVNKQWNVGLDVNRRNSTQQLSSTGTNLVDSWAFMLFSSYESKNKKYQLLGNYNHFNHHVVDQGGIRPSKDSLNMPNLLFLYDQSAVWLKSASSREKWNNFYIYQQYVASNGLQLFSSIDYKILADTYYDNNYKADSTVLKIFYKKQYSASLSDSIHQFTNYHLFDAKFGIKGFYKGFNYRLSVEERLYNYRMEYNSRRTNATTDTSTFFKSPLKTETILGAWASYYFPDSVRKVIAEAQFSPITLSYLLKGVYYSNFLKLEFKQILSPPSILQNQMYGYVFNWNNSFNNTLSTNFSAILDYRVGRFGFRPSGNLSFIGNYIYFDENATPKQDNGTITVLRVGLGASYDSKRFSFFTQTDFVPNSTDIIRMPVLSINTRIAYQFIYSKVLHINTGIEFYYKSAYRADSYMPFAQQFFISNQSYYDKSAVTVWGAPVADVFADFKIRRVRIFLKVPFVNQLLSKPQGFFVTPYYTGLKSGFSLGLNWPLFD